MGSGPKQSAVRLFALTRGKFMPDAQREDVAMERARQRRTVRPTLSISIVVVGGLPVPPGIDLVGHIGEGLVVIGIERTHDLAPIQDFSRAGVCRDRVAAVEVQLLGG